MRPWLDWFAGGCREAPEGCWKFSLILYILLSSIFCRYSWYFDLRTKSILSLALSTSPAQPLTYWLGRYDYTMARRAGQCFIESHPLPTRWRISNQSSYDGWHLIRLEVQLLMGNGVS